MSSSRKKRTAFDIFSDPVRQILYKEIPFKVNFKKYDFNFPVEIFKITQYLHDNRVKLNLSEKSRGEIGEIMTGSSLINEKGVLIPLIAKILEKLSNLKYEYMGPGTNLFKHFAENIDPVNPLDSISQEHDNRYINAAYESDPKLRREKIHEANIIFLKKVKQLKDNIDEVQKEYKAGKIDLNQEEKDYINDMRSDAKKAHFAIKTFAETFDFAGKRTYLSEHKIIERLKDVVKESGLFPEINLNELSEYQFVDLIKEKFKLSDNIDEIVEKYHPVSEEEYKYIEPIKEKTIQNENIPEVKEMPTERIRIDEIRKLNQEGKLAEYIGELKARGGEELIIEYRERVGNDKVQTVHETVYPEDLFDIVNEGEKINMGGEAPERKPTGSKKVSDNGVREQTPMEKETVEPAIPVSTSGEAGTLNPALPDYTSPHPPGTVEEARAAQAAEEARGQEHLARGGVYETPHPEAENIISGLEKSIAGVMSGVSKNPRFDLGRPVVGQSFNKDEYRQSQGGDVALTPEQRAMEEIWFEHWRFIPPGHGNGNQQPSDGLPYPEMRNSLMKAQNMNTQLRYSGDLKHGDVYIAPQYDYHDIPYSKRKIPMRPLFGRHTSWNRVNPYQNTGIGKIQFHRMTMQSTPIHNVYDPKVANLYYPNIVDGIRQ